MDGNRLKPNLTEFMRERSPKKAELPLTDEQIREFEKATLPASE